MALHLPIGLLKPALGWSRYRDANPVPTSPLADDITTAPSVPVNRHVHAQQGYTMSLLSSVCTTQKGIAYINNVSMTA